MRWLRWHGAVMALALAVLFLFNRAYPGSGWYFWLALAWAVALLIHFLLVKSLYADEEWASDRANDLRLKSYDHKHINAIRKHYIKPRAGKNAVTTPDKGRR